MLQVTANTGLGQLSNGALVKVAGLVLVRQRPGTAGGICFITIEDETGIANLVVFQKLFDHYRKEILQSRLLMVEGKLQIEGEVIHVIAKRCYNVSALLQKLTATEKERSSLLTLSRGDEKNDENYATKDKRVQHSMAVQGEIFHGGRNFR
jgi:error-prone DNA polymerase